jgi:type III secretory pathway component EscV
VTTEDRARLVRSLGLPADGDATRSYLDGGGSASAVLRSLVDAQVAELTWRRWFPTQADRLGQPGFRDALEALLSAGVAMGYAVDRFESACRDLADPVAEPDRWTEAFERAVAARNATDLRVHVHPSVRDDFTASNTATDTTAERWDGMVAMVADALFYELGIIVPRIALVADDALAPTELRIEINDAELPRQPLLAADRALVNDTVERLRLIGVAGELATNPANGAECATIAAADVKRCEQAGLTTWSRMGTVILAVSATTRSFAGGFVNRWLVEYFSTQLARAYPAVVAEVQRVISTEALCQVLRALVDEEISIRNLAQVFAVLAIPEAVIDAEPARDILFVPRALRRAQAYRVGGRLAPPHERRLIRVRIAMARYLSHKYTRGNNTLICYLVDPVIERRLADPTPLSAIDRALILEAVRAEVASMPATSQNPVILTTLDLRLRLRREVAPYFPLLAVMAYQEISPDLNIQPIAKISADFTDLAQR